MPTIKNESEYQRFVTGTDGIVRELWPGDEMATYDLAVLDLVGMTMVSPEPYFNPAGSQSEVNSSGVGDDREILIGADAETLEIVNNSGMATITVFLDSTENVPGLPVVAQSTRRLDVRDKVRSIILRFDAEVGPGECIVTQLRPEDHAVPGVAPNGLKVHVRVGGQYIFDAQGNLIEP